MRTHFAESMENLGQRLMVMCGKVETMLGMAMRSLKERNVSLAEEVLGRDDEVDKLDLQIEAECIRLIAHQQPVARDLRFIGTALKAITDLERIGDYAVSIAKLARKLTREPDIEPPDDLFELASVVRDMLKDVMVAFVTHDMELVEQAIEAEGEVDRLFHGVRNRLYDSLREHPSRVVSTSYLLLAARDIEYMSHHVVNIAERIHYIETGELTHFHLSDATA